MTGALLMTSSHCVFFFCIGLMALTCELSPHIHTKGLDGNKPELVVNKMCLSSRRTGPGRNFLIVVTDGQSYDDVRIPALTAQKQGLCVETEKE